jgi:hypothetical protein
MSPSPARSPRLGEESLTWQEQRLLAQFRNVRHWEPHASGRNLKPIHGTVERLMRKWNLGELIPAEQTIIRHWKELLGPERAQRCQPVRIAGDTRLVVAVAHPVLRQELEFEKRNILRKLRALPGCESIHSIQFQNR